MTWSLKPRSLARCDAWLSISLPGASSKIARCEIDQGHGGEHHWHSDEQWVRWSGT